MVDKTLKKEKEELLKQLFDGIDGINNNNDLKEVYNQVSKTNDKLDIHDSKFDNLVDSIIEWIKPNVKSKIKTKIKDILDNYDKTDKQGVSIYSEEERKQICIMIEKVNDICNRNFWDRFKKVLGIGS